MTAVDTFHITYRDFPLHGCNKLLIQAGVRIMNFRKYFFSTLQYYLYYLQILQYILYQLIRASLHLRVPKTQPDTSGKSFVGLNSLTL